MNVPGPELNIKFKLKSSDKVATNMEILVGSEKYLEVSGKIAFNNDCCLCTEK